MKVATLVKLAARAAIHNREITPFIKVLMEKKSPILSGEQDAAGRILPVELWEEVHDAQRKAILGAHFERYSIDKHVEEIKEAYFKTLEEENTLVPVSNVKKDSFFDDLVWICGSSALHIYNEHFLKRDNGWYCGK